MRVLLHIPTGEIKPYPRADDSDVIGLDSSFLELDVIEADEPSYNPATHRLERTQVADQNARTLTKGWIAVPISIQGQLAESRRQMALILDALPVADRAYFIGSRVNVEHALNLGDIELAMHLVSNQPLPPDRPDLEEAKAAILALFPTPES